MKSFALIVFCLSLASCSAQQKTTRPVNLESVYEAAFTDHSEEQLGILFDEWARVSDSVRVQPVSALQINAVKVFQAVLNSPDNWNGKEGWFGHVPYYIVPEYLPIYQDTGEFDSKSPFRGRMAPDTLYNMLPASLFGAHTLFTLRRFTQLFERDEHGKYIRDGIIRLFETDANLRLFEKFSRPTGHLVGYTLRSSPSPGVRFNANMDEAIAGFDNSGEFGYFILKRTGDEWVVTGQKITGIE